MLIPLKQIIDSGMVNYVVLIPDRAPTVDMIEVMKGTYKEPEELLPGCCQTMEAYFDNLNDHGGLIGLQDAQICLQHHYEDHDGMETFKEKINFCPWCGEKFTYKIVRKVEVKRETFTTCHQQTRLTEIPIED